MIAQVERLQASAALADAQQQARKADDDAPGTQRLAAYRACSRRRAPQLPLFVSSEALPPLQQFLDAAQSHHPGLSKVAAKRRQAESLHDATEALRKPQVLAFGMREVNTSGKPNWVAGVAVRWTLWDSIDRDKLSAAGQRKVEQAELTDAQVRSDIALLVEKNWLAVEQSRTQYLSGQAQEDLARELLRLRAAGLKEGTSTALELIDAQLNRPRCRPNAPPPPTSMCRPWPPCLKARDRPTTSPATWPVPISRSKQTLHEYTRTDPATLQPQP